MRTMNARRAAVVCILFFICFTAAAIPADSISTFPSDTITLPDDSVATLNDSLPDGSDTTFVNADAPVPRQNSWSNSWGSGWGNGWNNSWGNTWGNGWGNSWGSTWGNGWNNSWGNGWGNDFGYGLTDTVPDEPDTILAPPGSPLQGFEFVSLPPASSPPSPSAFDDFASCSFRYVRNLAGDSMFIIRIYDETIRDTFHIPRSRETDALAILYHHSCSTRLPRDLFSLPDSVTRPILCNGVQRPAFNSAPTINDTAVAGSRHVLYADCNFCDSIIWVKDGGVFRETDLRIYAHRALLGSIPLREYNMLPTTFTKIRGPIDTSLILEPVIGEHAGMYRAIIINQCYRDTSDWVNLVVVDSVRSSAGKTTAVNKPEADFKVEIHPNPIAEEVNIRTQGAFIVKIFNMEGKLMLCEKGADNLWLNTADFPGGIYAAHVIADAGETRRMLMK